jgi:hypothetical protein
MNLKDIDKKVLFDDRLLAVAGFSDMEKEVLVWLRETTAKHEVNKIDLTAPGSVGKMANSVIDRLNLIAKNKEEFFGFELVRQMGKEGYYLMDSAGKIIGRIQYVDDRI